MNLIDERFHKLRMENRTALIPFLTMGDPSLEVSVQLIQKLEEAGADLIELGVPYSDPLADGPVIQCASERALLSKVTITDCIHAAEQARQAGVKLPFILFTYFNPIFQFGLETFFELASSKGISGLIIPDLPIEEDEEVRLLAERYDIHLIPLVAPTSAARIHQIVQKAKGFIYCVSSLGVTGTRTDFHHGLDEFLQTVKEAASVPIAVGFGISNREQVKRFEGKVDGVIVGSAIVRQIEEVLPLLKDEQSREEGFKEIVNFVSRLRS